MVKNFSSHCQHKSRSTPQFPLHQKVITQFSFSKQLIDSTEKFSIFNHVTKCYTQAFEWFYLLCPLSCVIAFMSCISLDFMPQDINISINCGNTSYSQTVMQLQIHDQTDTNEADEQIHKYCTSSSSAAALLHFCHTQ